MRQRVSDPVLEVLEGDVAGLVVSSGAAGRVLRRERDGWGDGMTTPEPTLTEALEKATRGAARWVVYRRGQPVLELGPFDPVGSVAVLAPGRVVRRASTSTRAAGEDMPRIAFEAIGHGEAALDPPWRRERREHLDSVA